MNFSGLLAIAREPLKERVKTIEKPVAAQLCLFSFTLLAKASF
jgi:hypothetical protein